MAKQSRMSKADRLAAAIESVCPRGKAFLNRQRSFKAAWEKCDRPGWMMYAAYWLARRKNRDEAGKFYFSCSYFRWDGRRRPRVADAIRRRFPWSEIKALLKCHGIN